MSKDWIGNTKSTYTTLGASNHSDHNRAEHDYYATEPSTINELIAQNLSLSKNIWECAAGERHLSKRLIEFGFNVKETDIISRCPKVEVLDFLSIPNNYLFNGDIITNPPYKYALEFVQKALSIIPEQRLVCMFLKLTFLEGQKRYHFFKQYPPKYVYVYSSRRKCAYNGMFDSSSSATCYAWFVWEKGSTTEPIIRWVL